MMPLLSFICYFRAYSKHCKRWQNGAFVILPIHRLYAGGCSTLIANRSIPGRYLNSTLD